MKSIQRAAARMVAASRLVNAAWHVFLAMLGLAAAIWVVWLYGPSIWSILIAAIPGLQGFFWGAQASELFLAAQAARRGDGAQS